MIRTRICCRMLKRLYTKPSTRLMVEIKDHSMQLLLLLLLLKQIMFHNLHYLWSMLQLCNQL